MTRRIGAAAALLLLAGSALTAQYRTDVRFTNLSDFPRREWGLATVPFPKGVWTNGKTFAAEGLASDLIPFGARWSDGSVRFAQLAVRLDMPARSERLVTVTEGLRPWGGPFATSPWVQRASSRFAFKVVVTLDDGPRVADLHLHAIKIDTPVRKVLHYRARVPDTDFVYDLWLTYFSDQDNVPFEFRITQANADSQVWYESFKSIGLLVHGASVHVRGRVRRAVDYQLLSANGWNYLQLLGDDFMFDGQARDYFGELVFVDPGDPVGWRASTVMAAITQPLYGVSTDWRESGAFGPFGYVPPDPPWVTDGGRQYSENRYYSYLQYASTPGDPWEDMPMGMRAHASTTGDQHDYGVCKLLYVFASGLPHGIEEARFNASEEAYRPVHHRESNGEIVQARSHPNWVCWTGRAHFSNVVSPDRLGKPYPEPIWAAHGWTPKDHEHWSTLTLPSAYLLTMSHSLAHELANEAQLYISSHTIESRKPRWSTNGLSAGRAVGWTFLSMAWNVLLTDNAELREHMRARIEENVVRRFAGYQVTGPVKPLHWTGPDARTIPKHNQWKPWEESLAAMGLEAAFRVTGSYEAHRASYTAARNMLLHGWKIDSSETIIATAIAWLPNGKKLTPQQYNQREFVLWSHNTGFTLWALAATRLAYRYAKFYGDAELEARASHVLGVQYGQRVKPREGGWDRFSEWEAIW